MTGLGLVAWLVDTVIQVSSILVAALLAVSSDTGTLLAFVAVIGYYVVHLGLVATRGQSLGKMAVKIKIVRVDGRSLGFGGMLIREIIGKSA